MGDPIIEWYASPEAAAPLASWDYGTVDAGQASPAKRFYLYNNKTGTGASTATDLRYTTFDDADGGEDGDVVKDRWLQVKVVAHDGAPVSDPDGGFKAIGGAGRKKDLSAFALENGEHLELETRVAVPASPAAGARSFVQRVEFKFT